jgi:cell division control protein 6
MNIFSEIESNIFKNEEVLSTEYLPTELPHREGEVQQIAHNITPASKGKKPQNTFLFGPPGIGKTAVTKHVFKEFEGYSDRVCCIYINCWDFKTVTAVFSEMSNRMGFFVQRHGWGKDEVMNRFIEAMKKSKKSIIICLDEVDQLQTEALYDLLRINQYVQASIGIIFISNNPHIFASAEPRIRSSLATTDIEFQAYSISEMKDILQSRARDAFHSIDPAAITLCANEAVQKDGDVRVGLQCLLKAGREAEKGNAKRVKVEHVKKIMRKVKPAKPELLKEKITDTEREILKILGKKEWKSGELYREYKKQVNNPISSRTFRDYVNHLAEIKLVKIAPKRVGRHRIISKV